MPLSVTDATFPKEINRENIPATIVRGGISGAGFQIRMAEQGLPPGRDAPSVRSRIAAACHVMHNSLTLCSGPPRFHGKAPDAPIIMCSVPHNPGAGVSGWRPRSPGARNHRLHARPAWPCPVRVRTLDNVRPVFFTNHVFDVPHRRGRNRQAGIHRFQHHQGHLLGIAGEGQDITLHEDVADIFPPAQEPDIGGNGKTFNFRPGSAHLRPIADDQEGRLPLEWRKERAERRDEIFAPERAGPGDQRPVGRQAKIEDRPDGW